MSDIGQKFNANVLRCRSLLNGKTIEQIDAMLLPSGVVNNMAFAVVRREILAAERQAARVAKLRTMLSVTDERLALLEVRDESCGGCGVTIALKSERAAEWAKLSGAEDLKNG